MWFDSGYGSALSWLRPGCCQRSPTSQQWEPAVSPPWGAASGGAIGLVLFLVVQRTWKPPLHVSRNRGAFLAVSGLVLLLRSASEEIFWRWFVLGGLAVLLGVWMAAAISALGFAISHVEPRAIGQHLFTGSALASAYALTGSLVAVVAAHATYNFLVALSIEATRQATRSGKARYPALAKPAHRSRERIWGRYPEAQELPKTTAVRIMLGLRRPDSGRARSRPLAWCRSGSDGAGC